MIRNNKLEEPEMQLMNKWNSSMNNSKEGRKNNYKLWEEDYDLNEEMMSILNIPFFQIIWRIAFQIALIRPEFFLAFKFLIF